ncbi:hypothetical protein [Rathayibacter sp. AY1C5]|nr:hypothetical protein [Rathayibacter sp. AY1C5]
MQDHFDLSTYVNNSTLASGVPLVVEADSVVASAAALVATRLAEPPLLAA